jgi:hypothetical protein
MHNVLLEGFRSKVMACKSDIMILNRALVVRMLSLSLCLILGTHLCQASDTVDAINSYKELQSKFISDKIGFSEVHPEPIVLPSFERFYSSPFDKVPSSRPATEEIAMTGENSKEQVQDIEAINTVKQRTIKATLWILRYQETDKRNRA